jgi:hypothetical protein
MRRANYIFITKSDGHPPQKLLDVIAKYHPDTTPVLCTHAPRSLVGLGEGTASLGLEALKDA